MTNIELLEDTKLKAINLVMLCTRYNTVTISKAEIEENNSTYVALIESIVDLSDNLFKILSKDAIDRYNAIKNKN